MRLQATQGFDDSRLGVVVRGQEVVLSSALAKPYQDGGLLIEVPCVGADKLSVVCIASGPSLTVEDAQLVKEWRDKNTATRKVVVVNTTYQMCPWADVLYAMDRAWWNTYIDDVRSVFAGKLLTMAKKCHGVEVAGIEVFQNSGAGALAVAAKMGADNIIMLGYDAKYSNGKRHWHGDHPKGLKNAGVVKRWPAQFDYLARRLARKRVLNCTRSTAIKCFPVVPLEHALNECN